MRLRSDDPGRGQSISCQRLNNDSRWLRFIPRWIRACGSDQRAHEINDILVSRVQVGQRLRTCACLHYRANLTHHASDPDAIPG